MTIRELYSILLSENPREELLNHEAQLFELIPELRVCKGFNQNNEWHVYDVYEHILHVVEGVPSNLVLRLAALFHDIGKPECYTVDSNGVGHFYGHWNESLRIFSDFSNKHGIDFSVSSLVSKLIFYHDINISKLDDDGYEMLLETFNADGIKKLYQLKKADLLAQNKKYHYILDDYDKQKEKVLSKYL
jgi:tRNA nucleotidyltransferase (CCA-adding enzyme)